MGIEVSTMVDEKYSFFLEAVRQRLTNGFKDLVEVMSDGQGGVKINVSQTAPKLSTPEEVLKLFADGVKKITQAFLKKKHAKHLDGREESLEEVQEAGEVFSKPWTELEAQFCIDCLLRKFTFKDCYLPVFRLASSEKTLAEKNLEER